MCRNRRDDRDRICPRSTGSNQSRNDPVLAGNAGDGHTGLLCLPYVRKLLFVAEEASGRYRWCLRNLICSARQAAFGGPFLITRASRSRPRTLVQPVAPFAQRLRRQTQSCSVFANTHSAPVHGLDMHRPERLRAALRTSVLTLLRCPWRLSSPFSRSSRRFSRRNSV